MTDQTHAAREARLKEIAERGRHSSAMHTFEEVAVYARELEGDRAWLLAELSSADKRAEEMAGLLREAADKAWTQGFDNFSGPFTRCLHCDCTALGDAEIEHDEYCLVARSRTAADHAAKDRTDG